MILGDDPGFDWPGNVGKAVLTFITIGLYAALACVAVWWLLGATAGAHDAADWINQLQLHNRMGEFCCGPADCAAVDGARETPAGYAVGSEIIPYAEAMPFSIDGRLWICRAPDGHRRCVFNRPPGT